MRRYEAIIYCKGMWRSGCLNMDLFTFAFESWKYIIYINYIVEIYQYDPVCKNIGEGKYHSKYWIVFNFCKVSVIHWRSLPLAPVLLRPQVKTRFGWHLFKLEYRTGFDVDKATRCRNGGLAHEVKTTLISNMTDVTWHSRLWIYIL